MRKRLNTYFAGILLSITTQAVNGDEMWKDTFQAHGFVSQGLIHSSDNNFVGDSSETSAELTEIGINGYSRLLNNLSLAGQLLARRSGEMYDGSIELDYLILDLTIQDTQESLNGLRFGRFKNPIGLYNDTRDVAFTRPGIFMPQSIYFDNLRNAFLSNDGIIVYQQIDSSHGMFDFQLGAGYTPVDVNIEYTLVGDDIQGEIEDNGLTTVARIHYESKYITAAFSYVDTSLKMTGTSIFTGNGIYDVNMYVYSLAFTEEDWYIVAEYARQPLSWSGFSSFYPSGSAGSMKPAGHYIQFGYTVNRLANIYFRHEEGYSNTDDRNGTAREAILASLPIPIISPAHNYYTKSNIIGLRSDITNEFMVRLEYHDNEGTYFLSRRENNSELTVKDWDMVAILLSYRF